MNNAQPASNAVKEQVISEYIKTAAGRQKLAASMIQPLRFRRDYTSVGRRAFLVEQLPDGALPIYDKDPRSTAYIIGEEGENILVIQKPKRVVFPLFEPLKRNLNPKLKTESLKQTVSVGLWLLSLLYFPQLWSDSPKCLRRL